MKLRIVILVILVIGVLFWLRMRVPLDESGTKGTTTDMRQPQAAEAVSNAAPGKTDRAAKNAEPVSEKASTTESRKPSVQSREAVASTATAPTNLPLPRFVGGHRATVPPGGALVMGGWPQPNGNRLLMFASPTPVENGQVQVASRFISLPPERLKGGEWERFLTDENISKEGGVFSAREYAEALKQIEGFNDVDTLTSPSITTRFGQQATIEIGSETLEQTADGTQLKRDGISQAIIVRQVDGSADVDLAVTAAQFSSKP